MKSNSDISNVKKINIIIPCYNEQESINFLIESLNNEIKKIKKIEFNYLLIDDGSKDNTFEVIKSLCSKYKFISGIKLSRNFGSHKTVSAGLDFSKEYDAIINFTADMQEPPSLLPNLIKKWQDGFEVIWTVRKSRKQSLLGKFFSKLFYFIFLKISYLKNYPKKGPSGCFLLDKKIVNNWSSFKEQNRMVLGLISWMGFNQTSIEYDQDDRKGGKSSFSFFKLVNLAIDSFVAFSFIPIRLISYLGVIFSFFSFIYALYLIYNKIYSDNLIDGWASLMVLILFIGGIQLITLGVIGEYVWRGVDESRNRPLYLISEKLNIKD